MRALHLPDGLTAIVMATLQTARQPMRVPEPPGSPQGRVLGVKAWPREAEGPRAGLFVFPSPAALIRWEGDVSGGRGPDSQDANSTRLCSPARGVASLFKKAALKR